MRVLFASSEVSPFAKTGGLADVSMGLPAALARLGHQVTIAMPLYGDVDRSRWGLKPVPGGVEISVKLGPRTIPFKLWTREHSEGPEFLFMENQDLFGRQGIYGDKGGDFPDNALRYGAFSKAVLQVGHYQPKGAEVIHCNDWQTALVPYLQAYHYPAGEHVPVVLTIHNLAFHGQFPLSQAGDLGFTDQDLTLERAVSWEKLNFLKAGILTSDAITTVSRGYAREVLTPEFGCGLDGVLATRRDVLTGITNGADLSEWNPATDRFLPARYTSGDLSGKAECRRALIRATGLEITDQTPIIGMVGRLTEQKGQDLLIPALDRILEKGAALVILGTGQKEYEEALVRAAAARPDRIKAMIRYSDELAHLIEAGSDMFLMPSRFEPCGLNQIYSQIYGTVPVVHAVGGLEDTVVDPDESGQATGFKFRTYSTEAMLAALDRAFDAFRDGPGFLKMIKAGMETDFSWSEPARLYSELYQTSKR